MASPYKPDVIIRPAKARNEQTAVMTDLMSALMFMTPIFDVGQSEQAWPLSISSVIRSA